MGDPSNIAEIPVASIIALYHSEPYLHRVPDARTVSGLLDQLSRLWISRTFTGELFSLRRSQIERQEVSG